MASFDAWDVVKVPFPNADRPIRQYRPGLVLAAGDPAAAHELLWVLMITSAENRGWPDDVVVSSIAAAGLPAPSVVRSAKVTTIDSRDAERIGVLPRADRAKVVRCVSRILAALGLPKGRR